MGADRADEYGGRNAVEGELLVRVTPQKIVAHKNILIDVLEGFSFQNPVGISASQHACFAGLSVRQLSRVPECPG